MDKELDMDVTEDYIPMKREIVAETKLKAIGKLIDSFSSSEHFHVMKSAIKAVVNS